MQARVDIHSSVRLSSEAWSVLERAQLELDGIEIRLQHVADIRVELDRATRGKSFVIYALEHWGLVRSALDMVVVDLHSLLKGMWDPQGILMRIAASEDERHALARPWNFAADASRMIITGDPKGGDRAAIEASIRASEIARGETDRDRRFRRLFPDAAAAGRDVPDRDDVERRLVQLLKQRFKPVFDDRNTFRAHRFEPTKQVASASELNVAETARHLGECQELLNDLRMLCSESCFSQRGVRLDAGSRKAADVVDLILFGEINAITLAMAAYAPPERGRHWEWRGRYYTELHERHDRSGSSKAFNDRTLEPFPNPEVW